MANEKVKGAELWSKIKDLPIELFALPGQTVKDHVKLVEELQEAFPNDVYLTLRSAAVYPALEEALGNGVARGMIKLGKFEKVEVSQTAKYTVVKIVPRDV